MAANFEGLGAIAPITAKLCYSWSSEEDSKKTGDLTEGVVRIIGSWLTLAETWILRLIF